jgi:dTDP-4-dehydrorhamnose 3,5-epimerase-like enzyme
MTIRGEIFTDHRGTIQFVNDFRFEGIKRFYVINHDHSSIVRAWQGHKNETKYFYVIKGSFLVNWIYIDDWEKPGSNLHIHTKVLSGQKSEILKVSPGSVSGLKALRPDSTMIVFSDMDLADSKEDDYRYPAHYWDMKQP